MKRLSCIASLVLLPLLSWTLLTSTAAAAEQPGITDKEIKFGNIMPYSGPASALSVTGKVFSAYFDMINEKGGVNGRKLNMISLDDGFSPPKTVEATRRLVESDGVAFMFGTMGTAPSSATAKYLNGAKVPHLFLISSASKWNEPTTQPWLMALPWAPNYMVEAGIEVRYALVEKSQCALRGALPERRRRQGISARRQGSARQRGRQGAGDGDEFRGRRSHRGFADRHARQHQGRCVPDLQRDAARLRPGHPQGAGDRLAADAVHLLRLRQQGHRDGAGGARCGRRHHVGGGAETLHRRFRRIRDWSATPNS